MGSGIVGMEKIQDCLNANRAQDVSTLIMFVMELLIVPGMMMKCCVMLSTA